jgi:hypothetical protein
VHRAHGVVARDPAQPPPARSERAADPEAEGRSIAGGRRRPGEDHQPEQHHRMPAARPARWPPPLAGQLDEEVGWGVEGGGRLAQHLVAPAAVHADAGGRDQHPRRVGQLRQRFGDEPGAPEPAFADAPLARLGPPCGDRLAGEMHHRIHPGQPLGIDGSRLGVPGDRPLPGPAAHQRRHPVAAGGEERPERGAEQSRGPVIATWSLGRSRNRAWTARSAGSSWWRYRSIRSMRGRATQAAAAPRALNGGSTRSGRSPCRSSPGIEAVQVPPDERAFQLLVGELAAGYGPGAPPPTGRERPGPHPQNCPGAVLDPPCRSRISTRSQGGASRSKAPGRACQANASSAGTGRRTRRSMTVKGDGTVGDSL